MTETATEPWTAPPAPGPGTGEPPLDDPFDGIPAEVLDAAPYDGDTAGGCG